jgi:hypothetical protein
VKKKSFKHSRTFTPQVKSRHHGTKAAQAHAPVLTCPELSKDTPEHKLSKDTPEHKLFQRQPQNTIPSIPIQWISHNYKTKGKQNYLSFIDRCENLNRKCINYFMNFFLVILGQNILHIKVP